MFAQLGLPTAAKGAVVTVPNSAVIDSGYAIVLVQAKEGRFEPRDVKLGARGDGDQKYWMGSMVEPRPPSATPSPTRCVQDAAGGSTPR